MDNRFFDQDPDLLARALLGKVLRRRIHSPGVGDIWLAARIIETEAYFITEKGSHSSLGFTEKRKALFMLPGTIYMYYARGSDSLNFSARGKGNAVLVKSAFPYIDEKSPAANVDMMRRLNPGKLKPRADEKLCNGQTLLCRSLNLQVSDWNQQQLNPCRFILEDMGYLPDAIIQCRRLGIPHGRDGHLLLRFVDTAYAKFCTSNPLTKKKWRQGADYLVHESKK